MVIIDREIWLICGASPFENLARYRPAGVVPKDDTVELHMHGSPNLMLKLYMIERPDGRFKTSEEPRQHIPIKEEEVPGFEKSI